MSILDAYPLVPRAGEAAKAGLLVDTSTVDPGERFSYWSEATSDLFGLRALRRSTARPFSGQMIVHQLGPIRVFRNEADPISVEGTTNTIKPTDRAEFRLCLNLYGPCRVQVGSRRAQLQAGDLMMLAEGSGPFRMDCDGSTSWGHLVFQIPAPLLYPYEDAVRRQTGVRVSGQDGIGWLVSRFLTDLADTLDREPIDLEDVRLARGAIELLLTLFLRTGPNEAVSSLFGQGARLKQVKTYIEEHLGDASLRPTTIARAHFISERSLYNLFETEGMSVARWIRMRRLERCVRDLTDPERSGETISQIATRWGLPNPAHFSRLFREFTGRSPRDFRKSASATSLSASTISDGDRSSRRSGTPDRLVL